MTRSGLGGPAYSITSSARARRDGGIVRPSVFAVSRLIYTSCRVGCWTGRCAGLAPRIIFRCTQLNADGTLGPTLGYQSG